MTIPIIPHQPIRRTTAGNPRVIFNDAEIGEDSEPIVLGKFGIACRHQRQHLRPGVGHVGCGVKPVLEEKEQGETKPVVCR